MNEFERAIQNVPFSRNVAEYRMTIKNIVREYLLKDTTVGAQLRDNPDIRKTTFDVTFFRLEDGYAYMFFNMMHEGEWIGSQLERIENDYMSVVLYSTDTNNPEAFGPMLIQLIANNQLQII